MISCFDRLSMRSLAVLTLSLSKGAAAIYLLVKPGFRFSLKAAMPSF